MLLNDAFVRRQAARLADRLTRECGADDRRLMIRAFELVLQRVPTDTEIEASQRMLAEQRQLAAGKSPAERDRLARLNFCAALFNLNEFLHVD